MRNVGILGVGQTDFVTKRTDVTYPELVREGAQLAFDDAGLSMSDIEAVVVPLAPDALIGIGNGERWLIESIGATGKPVMRVNNGGATGASAVEAAWMQDPLSRPGLDKLYQALKTSLNILEDGNCLQRQPAGSSKRASEAGMQDLRVMF